MKKAEDILKEAKKSIAKKHGYKGWGDIIHDFFDGNIPAQFLEECEDEASLLAMSKVAEQSWDEALDELVRGFKGLPVVNKSTYMNNLFPKI